MELFFKDKPPERLAMCGPTYTRVTTRLLDPFISMRTIRVKFHESELDYETQINGTRESIGNYFRGASLNLSSDDTNEIIRTPKEIEFIPEHDSEFTILLVL